MNLNPESLECELENSDLGLSARRLWEHTELGQLNPFKISVKTVQAADNPAQFIDIIRFTDESFRLTGLTLSELDSNYAAQRLRFLLLTEKQALTSSTCAKQFLNAVKDHLARCLIRQAERNQEHSFFPSPKPEDAFYVPMLASALQLRLKKMGKTKADREQWLNTILNFQEKGIREEEMECSGILDLLSTQSVDQPKYQAQELADLCDFSHFRISVIPVLKEARQQLQFGKPPDLKFKRTKIYPKSAATLPREIKRYDRVLGYRIEQLEHQSLWGTDYSWQAVTHDGRVICTESDKAAFPSDQEATNLALSHAKLVYPKRQALGKWGQWAWSGGENYREWLITLPYHPANYLEGHYKVRNVLAHIRSDIRENFDGERILLLQEVQSDWAQQARRAISMGDIEPDSDECPPFLKEWPAVVMKLALLHAAHQGFDAICWTRGHHQVHRYGGRGKAGLLELYERTLPKAVDRMLKPFNAHCETLEVYVPVNFKIRQSEQGYEVFSAGDELLGIANSLEEARRYVPDMGQEILRSVHGVRLTPHLRQAIMTTGFPAWG